MRADFCDLCGQPMKEDLMWILYLSPPRQTNTEDYVSYLARIEKESKEICPTYKIIFDRIFEKRMIGILKLANDLKTIYDMQVKEPKRKKK